MAATRIRNPVSRGLIRHGVKSETNWELMKFTNVPIIVLCHRVPPRGGLSNLWIIVYVSKLRLFSTYIEINGLIFDFNKYCEGQV